MRRVPIYGNFVTNTDRIAEFVSITKVAYGLSAHLLSEHPKGSIKPFNVEEFYSFEEARKLASYSMSDLIIGKPVLEWGWVTIAEYAKPGSTVSVSVWLVFG